MARASADKATDPTQPAKQGRVAQLLAVFRLTREVDPAVVWWMLAAFAGTLLLAAGAGFLIGGIARWYLVILGIPVAFLAALLVMARRAERAAYARYEGTPGAASMALQNLRRGWNVEQEPVAIEPRKDSPAMVFRAVGRPGVVLVSDGPSQRAGRLAEGERKRVARVLGQDVPVVVVQCGEGEGQIPLRKLSGHLVRLKPQLTKTEVSEVSKRLRALGGVRPPIPKGIDPTRMRPDRRATRGR